MTSPVLSQWNSHVGMRLAAFDLMRCTEQTAALMSVAQGCANTHKDTIAANATLSMGGFLSQSMFNIRMPFGDGVYDRETPRAGAKETQLAFQAVQRHRPMRRPASVGCSSAQHPAGYQPAMDLDMICLPIDGKHAFQEGAQAGSVSAIACAMPREDGSSAFWLPELTKASAGEEGLSGRGRPSQSDLSPHWLMIVGNDRRWTRPGHVARSAVRDRLMALSVASQPVPVQTFVNEVFIPASPPGGKGEPPHVIAPIDAVIGVLGEPSSPMPWHYSGLLGGFSKQIFCGSSVALAVAAMLPGTGLELAVAISRHAQCVHASVAARATGGFLIAIPVEQQLVNDKRQWVVCNELVSGRRTIKTHEDFVRDNNALLVLSGISGHRVLNAVRRDQDEARVHTLCLSARTGSIRVLEHTIQLRGEQCARFWVYPRDEKTGSPMLDLPGQERTAGEWVDAFRRRPYF